MEGRIKGDTRSLDDGSYYNSRGDRLSLPGIYQALLVEKQGLPI